jgi:hypothetical protein
MKLVQTTLVRKTETGKAHLITWLPVDPRVRRGSVISLDDNPYRWMVAAQHSMQDADAIQTKWGLGLPSSQRTER